jgi:cell division transport system permease protein
MKSNKQKTNLKKPTIIISIASLAFIISLFFQLILGASKWKNEINSQMKIYIYLDDSLDVKGINSLIFKLKKLPNLNRINGKSDIQFKSKNKTASEFISKNSENYEDLLGENNPFKNLLIIGIANDNKNENEFNKLAKNLMQLDGVFEVTFPNKYITSLTRKINQISYFLLFIILTVCIFVYLQISNFVKINIYSNRILIKSMQLLGSTNHYIRKPYLIESATQGLIGGTIGALMAYLLFFYFSNSISEFKGLLDESQLQLISFFICTIFCTLFSLIATVLSINSKLKTSVSNLI